MKLEMYLLVSIVSFEVNYYFLFWATLTNISF